MGLLGGLVVVSTEWNADQAWTIGPVPIEIARRPRVFELDISPHEKVVWNCVDFSVTSLPLQVKVARARATVVRDAVQEVFGVNPR